MLGISSPESVCRPVSLLLCFCFPICRIKIPVFFLTQWQNEWEVICSFFSSRFYLFQIPTLFPTDNSAVFATRLWLFAVSTVLTRNQNKVATVYIPQVTVLTSPIIAGLVTFRHSLGLWFTWLAVPWSSFSSSCLADVCHWVDLPHPKSQILILFCWKWSIRPAFFLLYF